MALREALNRTPRGEIIYNYGGEVCEEPNFTANKMRRTQEDNIDKGFLLKDVQCSINRSLEQYSKEYAGTCLILKFDCKKQVEVKNDSITIKVSENFGRYDAEKIAAWLRNNGYNTVMSWSGQPHGGMLGSIFIWW